MPTPVMRPPVARKILAFLFAVVSTAGCASFPDVADRESVRISLTRTACFGTCPAYTVQIRGDGLVSYAGQAHVAVTGRHVDRISDETVSRLIEMFRVAEFFSLRDEYVGNRTDHPRYEVSFTGSGRTKRVIDYIGKEGGMPESVTMLEDAIDRLAGTAKWVQGTPELVDALTRSGIPFRSEVASNILADVLAHGREAVAEALAPRVSR